MLFLAFCSLGILECISASSSRAPRSRIRAKLLCQPQLAKPHASAHRDPAARRSQLRACAGDAAQGGIARPAMCTPSAFGGRIVCIPSTPLFLAQLLVALGAASYFFLAGFLYVSAHRRRRIAGRGAARARAPCPCAIGQQRWWQLVRGGGRQSAHRPSTLRSRPAAAPASAVARRWVAVMAAQREEARRVVGWWWVGRKRAGSGGGKATLPCGTRRQARELLVGVCLLGFARRRTSSMRRSGSPRWRGCSCERTRSTTLRLCWA